MNQIKKKVCVTGLGYVGLPTACILANSGYSVLGVDTDENVLERVKSAKLINRETNLEKLLINVLHNGYLRVSKDVAHANIHIVAVPTPLNSDKSPDISYVYSAIEAMKPLLRSGDLVLIESTCPIGTTEKIENKYQLLDIGIHLAYCPERVLPGNILNELIHNHRVVGGIDNLSTSVAADFYRSFIIGDVLVTDARTAEAVKLAENSYRDVNVAFANELSMIADHNHVDVDVLIKLANRHPRVQILQPGTGVGGHCIAVDPWFLVSSAPQFSTLISSSRAVNTKKTKWVTQKIRNAIRQSDVKKIVCLGLTYKANVADTRQSSALAIVQSLEREFNILRVDPYVQNTEFLHDALSQADMIVALVGHKEFLNIPSNLIEGKILLDFAGVFK